MKTITYQDNMQYWKLKAAAKEAGYKMTSDCYWCQIFTNAETGDEFMTSREEESTNNPLDDLAEMLTPSTTEEPTEAVQAITDRLTVLKAESIAEAGPFGQSPADREIRAISATLEEIKMAYRDYKRHYANCETVRGSYDAGSKTVVVLVPASMRQPKRGALRFDSKTWENRGQQKKLRGYRIAIRQYSQGKDANYCLEAWGDAYACLKGEKSAPSVRKTIPGYGPSARDAAITEALRIAESGLYTE